MLVSYLASCGRKLGQLGLWVYEEAEAEAGKGLLEGLGGLDRESGWEPTSFEFVWVSGDKVAETTHGRTCLKREETEEKLVLWRYSGEPASFLGLCLSIDGWGDSVQNDA